MSADDPLAGVIDLTRTILNESTKNFRTPPPSLLQSEVDEPTSNPNIERTVGNIQVQATKLALARFSPSLNADAKRTAAEAADPAKALKECLNMIGVLVALLVGEFIQTLREPLRTAELRFAVNVVVEERRARCVNLCFALERLIDEVESSPQADEQKNDKKNTKESDLVNRVNQLSLDPHGEDDDDDPNDYQYVSAGIVISQCKQLQRFEKALASSSSSSAAAESVLRIIVNDVRLHKNMITDAKNELSEFIEDPNIASKSDAWGIGSEGEDDEDDNPSAGPEDIRRLLDLAGLWVNKVNMVSILLTSLLKRRFVIHFYDQLLAADSSGADTEFAKFANGVTESMKTLTAEIDEFAGGLLDGDDIADLDEHSTKIKEMAVAIATLASETIEDEYSKWFVMFKEKFLEGI
ncbi:hypothetical protein V1517DRAFT_315623 [Lipomyces orientalis]|uniref:Uncharacterized protein n=1 Tax=Lipomyces orientalis TaxID=1233043 RepID=A0ACC3TUV5_9ASCO